MVAARSRRIRLRAYMEQEVFGDGTLRRLTRLCGSGAVACFGLVVAIGEVSRFTHGKKLVA